MLGDEQVDTSAGRQVAGPGPFCPPLGRDPAGELGKVLDETKPDAVSSFTDTYDHPVVVEAAAQRHLTVMMEKPLAVSMEHARRIQKAAQQGNIQVIVNYETSWYPSHGAIWNLVQERKALGDIQAILNAERLKRSRQTGISAFVGKLVEVTS